MSREVRKVTPSWNHPKNESGNFKPLHPGNYFLEAEDEWLKNHSKFQSGKKWDWRSDSWVSLEEDEKQMRFEDFFYPRPSKSDYMPAWPDEECTHLMMYETTSEGTPISPAFEEPEELAEWLFNNKASAFAGHPCTKEEWLAMISCGCSVGSAVLTGGELISGVAAISKPDSLRYFRGGEFPEISFNHEGGSK